MDINFSSKSFVLPKPSPNKEEYQKIIENGLKRFPRRKENYENFLKFRRNSIKLDYLPIKMDYEVSNKCNFRCKMCIMSDEYNSRANNMTYEDFKQSLDDMFGLIEIKLQGVGEPLLNKELFKMIELAVDRNIWVRTTTNGSLLHLNNNYKKLIDSNPGEIQISIDAASKETFENIRIGSDFNRIVDNVSMLNEYAQSKNSSMKISCWMLVQKENFNELEDTLKLASKIGFKRFIYSIDVSSWGGGILENFDKRITKKFTLEIARRLIELGKDLNIDVSFWNAENKYEVNTDSMKLCDWIFGRAFISADMKIVPCCVISDSNMMNLGNARMFYDSWNSKEYQNLRQKHLTGCIPDKCKECYLQ